MTFCLKCRLSLNRKSGNLGVDGSGHGFRSSRDFQQKKPVFSGFSQPLRIFSGGYGIGLVQILTVLMNLKYRWTEMIRFA
jgi:hypothetical protein